MIWDSIVKRFKNRPRDHWSRGPYITSLWHTLVTLLGLQPYPFGVAGIYIWLTGNGPWFLLASDLWTFIWYWIREYKETGLRPKPKIHARLTREAGYTVYRTFGQRWDTWMDVIFPTIGYGLFVWFCVHYYLGG